jgi:hypothetical protein
MGSELVDLAATSAVATAVATAVTDAAAECGVSATELRVIM